MYTSAPLTLEIGRKSTISALAWVVNEKFKVLCSAFHDSILTDPEAVEHFSWETVWLELCKMVNTDVFMKLVRYLEINKPLLCLSASMN